MNIQSVSQSQLPTIQPKSAPSPGETAVREIYAQITDSFIPNLGHMLKEGDSTTVPTLTTYSRLFKHQMLDQVQATTTLPDTKEQAVQGALDALGAGLCSGAIDGALTFTSSAPPAENKDDASELEKSMKLTLDTAKEILADAGVDYVKEVSQFNQAEGVMAVEAAANKFPFPGLSVEAYQGYLLGTFSIGYTVGVLQSAVILGATAHAQPRLPQIAA